METQAIPIAKAAVSNSGVNALMYAGSDVSHADADVTRPGFDALVCGLLIIVPVFTGLMAITLGVCSVRNRGSGADRGLGIAGIVLGSVNLVLWLTPFFYGWWGRLW